MSSFEDLFTSTDLDVIVPESGIAFPPESNFDEWLENLNNSDRKEAFFDEHLQTLLLLRVPQAEPVPSEPPRFLLDFLAHLQILLEASYIAQNDGATTDYTVSPSPFPSGRVNVPTSPPPRGSSIKKPTHLNLSLSPNPTSSHHPSILPPSTPNPTPQSAAVDERYLQAEGVVLTSRIWGQDAAGTGVLDKKQGSDLQERTDDFSLLWSKKGQVWVAVYRSVLDIAFLRLHFDSPLLCLTLSATLRDKPLALASSSSPLAMYLKSKGGLPADPASPTSPSTPVKSHEHHSEQIGPPEFNLLAGLYAGPTFAPVSSLGRRIPSTNNNTPAGTPTTARSRTPRSAGQSVIPSTHDDLNLFSTRLGPVSRAKLFALPPIEPETPSSSAMITPTPLPGQSALATSGMGSHFRSHTVGGRGQAVLKKSFRKTLETTNGFKVRMRTVFVPAVLLDEGAEHFDDIELDGDLDATANVTEDGEETDQDPDRLTSGASERTVVLCVEIETEGDPLFRPANIPDFVVEKVDISITGNAGAGDDGVTATLIGWDTASAIVNRSGRKPGRKLPKATEKYSFPLYLGPHEQHNLLYAVTFLRSPQEEALDGLGSALNLSNLTTGVGMNALPSAGVIGPNGAVKPPGPDKSLQRAVNITIFGRPCYIDDSPRSTLSDKVYHFPTSTFSSRWNCILDLSLSQQLPHRDFSQDYGDETPLPTINALPEPPSPFPVSVSMASPTSFTSIPASTSFPSIASVVSPRERRSIGFGLDLGSADNRRGSPLAYPLASGPATTGMTDKRHTLPNLARTLPSHVQSAGPVERPGSALGPSRERKDSLGLLSSRQRRDSLPAPSPPSSKYAPPSVNLTANTLQSMKSPTTYEAPPPPPFKDVDKGGTSGVGLSVMIPSVDQQMGLAPPPEGFSIPPMTPAYPAFPTNGALSPTPLSQGPLIAQGGNLPPNSASTPGAGYIGPSVEVRRERGMAGFGYAGMGSATPQTPGPVVGFGPASRPRQAAAVPTTGRPFENENGARGENNDGTGSGSIVVSVGLLSQQSLQPISSYESSSPRLVPATIRPSKPENDTSGISNGNLIYPLSTFILDIFVFNRSSWTRRFEISCPDLRSRRKRREMESFTANRNYANGKQRPGHRGKGIAPLPEPGVLPLENRVRIGPLLPSACQSVRMKFLAVSPGVHSIDTLTLTDVESGLAMNLRSVMDVVVHEPV
ncbi:hypothetical protein GYMLUDRAFT_308496 [Collybiopsis luxurians FD-317 M1]|nr:hypothetical protein GYMLUDRAFT_308496 [Collybiopsis luxurians FD-317 M1]